MIFGSIYEEKYWSSYPLAIQKALRFLRDNDISTMEVKEREIEGRDIFIRLADTLTKELEDTRLETHREYVDVQFVAEGEERLGYMVSGELPVAEAKEADDLYFHDILVADEVENFVVARKGNFTIFFPGEVHRPLVAVDKPTRVKKAIIKVRASLI